MASNRDNFTKSTIDVLAKRVGFLCSNPNCRKPTVGPNSHPKKFTLIGIAAHITAAASGGPRYDNAMSPEERKNIANGIWLCSNCASLIDKDEENYPVDLLEKWKQIAEEEMKSSISGKIVRTAIEERIPFLELDLIWSSGSKITRGYSPKNKEVFGDKPIPVGGYAIMYWDLTWNFYLTIYNNSPYPAYNMKLVPVNEKHFTYISKLPKINNLRPFDNLDLEAIFRLNYESNGNDANELIRQKIPEDLIGLEIDLVYLDDNRREHITRFRIKNDGISNEKQ